MPVRRVLPVRPPLGQVGVPPADAAPAVLATQRPLREPVGVRPDRRPLAGLVAEPVVVVHAVVDGAEGDA